MDEERGWYGVRKLSVLVVDDEEGFCRCLGKEFGRKGYAVSAAHDGKAALEALAKAQADVMLLDVVLPRLSGTEVLKRVRRDHPRTQVIMLTGNATVETAIESMKQGAFDYLTKPVNLAELCLVVERAFEATRVRAENEALRWELGRRTRFDEFVGKHASVVEIRKMVSRVAETDSPVLICGETGTGKELVARMLHHESRRSKARFLAVNCAAFQENLLETELFGHEKGAFTDAGARKPGLVELADGGTLFLDEIGNMSPAVQAKVLRLLDAGEYRRVGGTDDLKSACRVVSATNQDLGKAIKDGRFREDLYYRLNVVMIKTPPLRERREDVPLLVEHFLDKVHALQTRGRKTMSRPALDLILGHPWPGNVRELENAVERAVILSEGSVIEPSALCLPCLEAGRSVGDALADVEKAHILAVLGRTGGNKSQAAAILKVDVKTVYNKLKEFGIA
ncbi:MAG: sigma-54-dependent Fis family transcriptional regulator [Elusimicrobia bacterium]|nr:sigma-54-dependent Fis family transcriptional regulator [Elusimicrobiota bacterium]